MMSGLLSCLLVLLIQFKRFFWWDATLGWGAKMGWDEVEGSDWVGRNISAPTLYPRLLCRHKAKVRKFLINPFGKVADRNNRNDHSEKLYVFTIHVCRTGRFVQIYSACIMYVLKLLVQTENGRSVIIS